MAISLFNVFATYIVPPICFVVLVRDVFHLQYGEKSSVYRTTSQETNKSHCSVSTKIYLIVFGRGHASN